MIVSPFAQDGEMLKPLCEKDKIPLFVAGATEAIIEPPGWVFAYPPPYEDQAQAFLKWLSINWDYTKEGRKPRIGAFGWNEPMGLAFANGAMNYCLAPPINLNGLARK